MIRIVGDNKARALKWFQDQVGQGPYSDFGNFSALLMERQGCIQAVVLYNCFAPANSIDMHIAAVAGGRWLTRPFLAAAFGYPFVQLGLRRVTARIAADNLKIKRFIEHLGFIPEGCAREAAPNGADLLIYGMLKRECRYIVKAELSEPAQSSDRRDRADGLEHRHSEGECRA